MGQLRRMGWGVAVQTVKPVAEEAVGVNQPGRTYAEWRKMGVKLHKGVVLAAPATRHYYLVQPDGARGASFLVNDNYKTIMRWNRST